MATEGARGLPAAIDLAPQRRSGRVRRLLAAQPLGAVGLAVFIVLVVCAAAAPIIATHDPLTLNLPNQFQAPSSEHWFGTDAYGRDLFSRVIYGARTSVFFAISTVALGITTGAVLGIISAYHARLDLLIQRFVDALLAIPNLLLAVAIVAVLGPSLVNTMLAIAVAFIPGTSRVLRSQALTVKQQPYVEAARAAGASDLRVLTQHIAPNCFAPFIVMASTALAAAILAEASLSFLNLGTPPPRPSWGEMLSGSVQLYATQAPWLAIFPGLAITFTVLGFSLFGDALRDVLDPRLRGA